FYVVSLSKLTGSDYLRAFWAFGFMPLDPIDLPQWLAEQFVKVVGFTASTSLAGLATFLVLVGSGAYLRQHWAQLGLLFGPLVITLLASAVQVYPFANRMVLFVTPLIIILLAQGTDQLVDWLTASRMAAQDGGLRLASSVALLGLLLYFPLWVLGTNLKQPLLYNSTGLEDFTAVMAYLEDHIEPGDTVYAYYNAVLPFRYYAPQYHLQDVPIVEGIGDEPLKMNVPVDAFLQEIDGLKSQAPGRIWLLFSHVITRDGLNEEQLYLTYLDHIGTRTDALIVSGSSVYRYDLSQPPAA
ncbi:MAG: hypothetical protein K8J31_24325, partial [Anaerolineae bacterium]|nr:hypothetical protein [Anaerolineae bacterium]